MDAQSVVERFIADLKSRKPETTEAHVGKFRQRVPECIKFFEKRGITSPVEADYELLKTEFLSTHSNGRGGTLSPLSVRDWALQTKKVYDWLKGEQQMTFTAPVIDAEVKEQEITQNITPEDDTKPRRGRKPKPDDERRSEKFSIYLTPALYEAMKDLAYFSRQDISDIFFSLAADYVERNRDKLDMFRNFLEQAGTIK